MGTFLLQVKRKDITLLFILGGLMKILLITQNFYPEIGSGANRFKNLYLMLSKHHEVNILTTHPNYPNAKMYKNEKYWDEEYINASSDIFRLQMRVNKQAKSMFSRLLYYFELAFKIRSFVKSYQNEYDAIYVTTPNIFIPWSSFFFQKKLQSTDRILEVRDLWPDSVKEVEKLNIKHIFPILKYLEKRMYKKSDKIVINNEGFRSHIAGMVSGKEILYLPNAFNNSEVEFKSRMGEFKVIYTGNIGLAQSYEQIVEVADLLEKEKIKFTVVSYGMNAARFREHIHNNNFQFIDVHSEKSREECLEMIREHNIQLSLLKNSDVFLNVLPGKIIDGIGCGVPVVANLGGYANKLINENEVGYSKAGASSYEIVQAIKRIKEDIDLESSYRSNAKKVLYKEFLWENNIDKVLGFLNK